MYVYICVHVYTRTYILEFFSSEGIDSRRLTQLWFEIFFLLKILVLSKHIGADGNNVDLEQVLYNVLWPAGTRTGALLCVISQKWVVMISKRFLNQYNKTFPFQWFWSFSVDPWTEVVGLFLRMSNLQIDHFGLLQKFGIS